MGQRRKGEQPVPKEVVGWSEDHQVFRCLSPGENWFSAWHMQMCTPYPRLAKLTKIAEARLREIKDGATFTRDELEALAKAWWITRGIAGVHAGSGTSGRLRRCGGRRCQH